MFKNYNLLFITLLLTGLVLSCITESTPQFKLEANPEPSDGGSVTPVSMDIENRSFVEVKAVPNEYWIFTGWSGDLSDYSSEPVVKVFMNRHRSIKAHFEKIEYPLTINVEGNGVVTKEILSSKSTTQDIPHATALRLKAEPDPGWEFVKWEMTDPGEGIDLTHNELDIEMLEPLEITAHFQRTDFLVRVIIEGEGTVEREVTFPAQKVEETEYPFETVVNLKAVSAHGWEFIGWSGAATGSDTEIELIVEDPIEIVATFDRIRYPLEIKTEGEGSVITKVNNTVTTDNQFPFQTDVELTAAPGQGWLFHRWRGDAQGSNNPTIVTVDKAKSVEAIFSPDIKLTTNPVTNITHVSAESGGTLVNNSNVTIVSRGLCWSTSPNTDGYTIENNPCKEADSNNDVYGYMMKNLNPSTRYYVRAVVVYSHQSRVDFILGNEVQFQTQEPPIMMPELSTAAVSAVTYNSAMSGGTISSDGGAPVTERGVCFGTSQNPDKSGTCTSNGSGTGSFASTLTSLAAQTVYYVRAYAVNSAGTSYGNQLSFTTDAAPVIPTVSTSLISSVTSSSATAGGNVTSSGGASVTERGVCVSTSQNPTRNDNCSIVGTGTGSFSTTMTGLNASTTYFVRAFATNSMGTGYGEQRSFETTAGSTPPPTSPPPSSENTQVALVFLDGVNLDVTVNGTLYSANTPFDYTFNNNGVTAGVKVVTVSGNLTTMQLNPNQLKQPGLDADGFGLFSYKVVNKNPDTNMFGIHAIHNSSQEFWGNAATSNPLGIIVSRLGDTVYSTAHADPLFYLGWRFDPVNQPNNRNFQSQWSNTGKMVFSFFNLGKPAN